jgi:hypothetical protein
VLAASHPGFLRPQGGLRVIVDVMVNNNPGTRNQPNNAFVHGIDTLIPQQCRVASYALTAWFVVSAFVFVTYSVATILHWAPHALYADQWRQYVEFITLPFPDNILFPDNGHRTVVPNLIAWVEVLWFDGNQWLQIAFGIACALTAGGVAAWNCARDRATSIVYRAAAAFLCFFAIFWLANVRTLGHSAELVHTTLPMLCLMLALHASIRAPREGRPLKPVIFALTLALIGTFSFGYGMSIFIGIFSVLLARKAHTRQLVLGLAGFVAGAALYLGLPGSSGVTASMTFAPFENLLIGARWLGAPFVTLLTYLWDPGASGLVPTHALSRAANSIAMVAARSLPDLSVSVLPQAAVGGFGMLALLLASTRRLRARTASSPMEAMGFGIAWFGLGAAGIVSLSRLSYFRQFPEQIYANRYLPWPCLFWLGLGLIVLSRTGTRGLRERCTVMFVALLPLLAWPTHYGGRIYAALVRGQIDNTAAGSVVGVLSRGSSFGETVESELVRGIAVLRPLHLAQFGSPYLALLGRPLPSRFHLVPDVSIEARPIENNLLGEPGTAIVLRESIDLHTPHDRLWLIDARNVVVGYVVRDARLEPPGYSGYVQGARSPSGLRAADAP